MERSGAEERQGLRQLGTEQPAAKSEQRVATCTRGASGVKQPLVWCVDVDMIPTAHGDSLDT